MKPIRLEVQGLQSYIEPVVVDFEALGRYGLFGIFGPIGSGKSSLDALTLALYGLVDRVSGRSKKGVMNADADRMEVRLTFSVRTPEGIAEVYEVHRSYRATRDDGPTSAQRIASRLVQHTDDGVACSPPLVLADKEREVNDTVAAIVGLCAEDFMRAVVLPQGRFLDVLHLKGSERRGMLQRIFRLSAYGAQLRQKLRGRQQDQREQLAAIDGELQGLGPASPAAVAAARQQLVDAKERRTAATDGLQRARSLHEAALQARRQHTQLTEAREALEAIEAQAAALQERAIAVADAEALAPQRGLSARWAVARDRAAAAEAEAEATRTSLTQAEAHLVEAAAQLEAAQAAQAAHVPALSDAVRTLDALEQRMASEASLEERLEQATVRATRARARREAIDEDLETAHTALTELEPRRRSLRRQLGKVRVHLEERRHVAVAVDAHRALTTAQSAHEEATERAHRAEDALVLSRAAEAAALETVRSVQARVEAAATSLREAPHPEVAPSSGLLELGQERIEALTSAWERRDAADAARAAQRDRVERAERGLVEAEAALKEVEGEQRALDAARWAHEQAHAAAQLAVQLTDDVPCPVCGSPEHPAPAVDPRDAAPTPSDPERLERARAEAARQGVAVAEARASLQGCEAAVGGSEELVAAAHSALRALLPSLEVEPATALDDIPRAQAALAEAQRGAAQRAAWLQRQAELEAALQELRLDEERAQGPLHAAQGARQRAEADAKAAAEALDAAAAAVGQAWSAWSDVAGEQTTLFDVPQLQRRIDDRDGEARELERTLAAADARREQLQQAIADGQTDRAGAIADVAEADAQRDRLQERWQALLNDLREVLSSEGAEASEAPGSSLTALADALRERRGVLQAERAQHLQALQRCSDHRDATAAARADAAAAHARADTAASGARQALTEAWEAWLEASPTLRAHGSAPGLPAPLPAAAQQALDQLQARIRALPAADVVARWRAELDEHRAQRRRLEARIEALADGADPLLSDDAFATLEEELAEATRHAEATADASARAQAEHDALVQRLTRVQQLQATRVEVATELERLDQLATLLRGDRFVEFVANDLLRELAATASSHLRTLSEGRYALVLDEQGGFLVQDADAGGTTRPVTSLSGGESFLSALALALALSTQIQARGARPLEFFFLDEGFGSLDPEALDRVMSAIERLNDGHRVIGLISHVPGVRERIPMHLVVHPAGSRQQGSSVELRVQ